MPSGRVRAKSARLKTKAAKPAPRPHILAVDDAKAVRTVAETALAGHVCDVTGATNGFNALFQMEQRLPALILLDVSMPVMDGLEFLTMLRSKPEFVNLPVIMLTSPADHRILPQLHELGIQGILTKPFTPAALVEKVLAVLPLAPAP